MRQHLIAIFLLLTFSACGQSEKADKPVHFINITGTRLFIDSPPNFKAVPGATALQDGNDNAIQVIDLEGGSFNSNGRFVNKEEFERQGFKVLEYKELNAAGFPAKFFSLQKDLSTRCQFIFFGDSTFAASIFTYYHTGNSKLESQLREMLLTAKYDKSLKINPLGVAPFVLDDSKSKFKFARYTANTFTYSVGGIEKEFYGDEPTVTVVSVPGMFPSHLDSTFSQSLIKNGFVLSETTHSSESKVNGNPAYESEGYGMMQGQKVLVYRLCVTKADVSVALQAIAKSDFEDNLREFKKLAQTIRLK